MLIACEIEFDTPPGSMSWLVASATTMIWYVPLSPSGMVAAGRARGALAGAERPGLRHGAQQQRAGRHLAGGREVGVVDPAAQRRGGAVVGRGPVDRDRCAGRCGRRGDVIDGTRSTWPKVSGWGALAWLLARFGIGGDRIA